MSAGLLVVALAFSGSTKLLMPGPLATAHGSVETCSACHTGVRPGPMGWLHTVLASADPRKDSLACISCHTIGATAVNPHTVEMNVLERTSERIQRNTIRAPRAIDSLREAVFPVSKTFETGVFCQTCHKEHKGEGTDLASMPDHRCQACHTAEIHSFTRDHPEFGAYPFKRRTRLFFDHVKHFQKHFPDELAKRGQSASLPDACSDCHTVGTDSRHMNVRPFKQICSSCHLGQIVGRDRPEGPKGITLLTLPGLDVDTLEDKGLDIGAWPEESEAELSAFMELLIGTDDRRRKMLAVIKAVDLLNLSEEPDETITAVQSLAWEIKDLIHTYSSASPTKMLDRLSASTQVAIKSELAIELLASMPRDVLMGASREWLPNLNVEIQTRRRKQVGDEDTVPNETDDTGAAAKPDEAGDVVQSEPADVVQPEVDAETWAELGGWYRQDYSILYRPTGHQDRFMKAWLDLTGRTPGEVDASPASETFSLLSGKTAQGRCSKCHSIDALGDGARQMQWSPSQAHPPNGRFTTFSHTPHLSVVGKDGCLTCHQLNPTASNHATYEQNNPKIFESNFKPVQKQVCAGCHKPTAVRSDCLLCHAYHASEIATPAPKTNLPRN